MKFESLNSGKFKQMSKKEMSFVVGGTSVITTKPAKQISASNDLSTDGKPGVYVPGADWERVTNPTKAPTA